MGKKPEHFLFIKEKISSHSLQIRFSDMCPLIVFQFFFKWGGLRMGVDISLCSILSEDQSALGINNICTSTPDRCPSQGAIYLITWPRMCTSPRASPLWTETPRSQQSLDSSFLLLEQSTGRGLGPPTGKAWSLLGMHCTGIQESRTKIFDSFQLPLWPVPTVPAYWVCVGKVRGLDGKDQRFEVCSFGWSSSSFTSREKSCLTFENP